MKNKKNVSFFILFLIYIVVFFAGYRYVGKDIFYASLPMIFGASVIYNYTVGFITIILNIPATFFLMYAAGIPFAIAVKELSPFVILLQCVIVVIPSLVKIYNEKKYIFKSREMNKRIDDLMDKLNDIQDDNSKLLNENIELKLIIDRYKANSELDHLTGFLNRDAIIRRVQKYLTLEEKKIYIFIYFNKLRSINEIEGIFAGDQYIHDASKKLDITADEIGRISDDGFLIISNISAENEIAKKLSEIFREDIEIVKKIPKYDDRIDDIFRRGTLH